MPTFIIYHTHNKPHQLIAVSPSALTPRNCSRLGSAYGLNEAEAIDLWLEGQAYNYRVTWLEEDDNVEYAAITEEPTAFEVAFEDSYNTDDLDNIPF